MQINSQSVQDFRNIWLFFFEVIYGYEGYKAIFYLKAQAVRVGLVRPISHSAWSSMEILPEFEFWYCTFPSQSKLL
jgi:hypothetical protein